MLDTDAAEGWNTSGAAGWKKPSNVEVNSMGSQFNGGAIYKGIHQGHNTEAWDCDGPVQTDELTSML